MMSISPHFGHGMSGKVSESIQIAGQTPLPVFAGILAEIYNTAILPRRFRPHPCRREVTDIIARLLLSGCNFQRAITDFNVVSIRVVLEFVVSPATSTRLKYPFLSVNLRAIEFISPN